MKQAIPKELLRTKYRKEMWAHSQKIIRHVEKILPVTSAYLLGSFTTKKKRPADVDFIILLKTKDHPKSKWSVDLVIAPENAEGTQVLEDARKWMRQKYGTKKSTVIKLK